MNYVSTRGGAPVLGFSDVVLEGLATDGGLYVPEHWPRVTDPRTDRYVDCAHDVMWPFVEATIDRADFTRILDGAYSTFHPPVDTEPEVIPVVEVSDGLYVAELFWGPTAAFKDVALQLLGRLFDHELDRRGQRATVVGATSGDTGSAAIEACRDRAHLDVFILHPHGKTSEVQRKQMTTVDAPNVFNIAIEGSFDDCQDIVKALFEDQAFRRANALTAVNSINWARVMAQIVYYYWAPAAVRQRLGLGAESPVDVCVPTGNFGNVFAGFAAQQMGAALRRLIVASNENDILSRFFASGALETRTVVETYSPSMDIQVSSNLERLLFEMVGRSGDTIDAKMREFRSSGIVSFESEQMAWLSERWAYGRVSNEECLATISRFHERGYLADPHTAVGLEVAERLQTPDVPMVCLGTAHPAKFPEAIQKATGEYPVAPPMLAAVMDRPERFEVLPNDLDTVRGYMLSVLGSR